jgi:hypothetical protein
VSFKSIGQYGCVEREVLPGWALASFDIQSRNKAFLVPQTIVVSQCMAVGNPFANWSRSEAAITFSAWLAHSLLFCQLSAFTGAVIVFAADGAGAAFSAFV